MSPRPRPDVTGASLCPIDYAAAVAGKDDPMDISRRGGTRPGAGRPSAAEMRYRQGIEDIVAQAAVLHARARLLLRNPDRDPTVAQLRSMTNGLADVTDEAA